MFKIENSYVTQYEEKMNIIIIMILLTSLDFSISNVGIEVDINKVGQSWFLFRCRAHRFGLFHRFQSGTCATILTSLCPRRGGLRMPPNFLWLVESVVSTFLFPVLFLCFCKAHHLPIVCVVRPVFQVR